MSSNPLVLVDRPRPEVAVLTLNQPEKLNAPSFEAAIHLENRTQILASTGGEVAEAAAAFMEKRAPRWNAGDESEP